LLVRLLAGAVLIALCSIAATAWLAARSTTVAIQQQQGQALADDAKIYNTLVGFAATHRSWSGIGKEISKLALDTDRQISLTTRDRRLISGRPVPATQTPSAIVWPLDLSTGLGGTPTDATGQIDSRVVGPFKLSDAARSRLDGVAQRVLRGSARSPTTRRVGRRSRGRHSTTWTSARRPHSTRSTASRPRRTRICRPGSMPAWPNAGRPPRSNSRPT
jgi:two-component system sensor histidine kinase BaeS